MTTINAKTDGPQADVLSYEDTSASHSNVETFLALAVVVAIPLFVIWWLS